MIYCGPAGEGVAAEEVMFVSGEVNSTATSTFPDTQGTQDGPLPNNGFDAPGGARGTEVTETQLINLGFSPRRKPRNS
jgi:hypothetical protein